MNYFYITVITRFYTNVLDLRQMCILRKCSRKGELKISLNNFTNQFLAVIKVLSREKLFNIISINFKRKYAQEKL